MKCRHIPTDTDIINKSFSAKYVVDRDFRVCRKCGKKIMLSHPALAYVALSLFLPIEVCLSVLFEVGWSDIKLYYGLTECCIIEGRHDD